MKIDSFFDFYFKCEDDGGLPNYVKVKKRFEIGPRALEEIKLLRDYYGFHVYDNDKILGWEYKIIPEYPEVIKLFVDLPDGREQFYQTHLKKLI